MRKPEKNSIEEEPTFKINEKRSWVLESHEKDESPVQPKKRLPSYVEQLETRTNKVEEAFEKRKSEFQEEQDAFRKRMRTELEKKAAAGNRRLLEGFIQVLDYLDMALASAGQKGDFDSLLQGLKLTRSQFQETLKTAGVIPVAAEGETFDPARHEAFMVEPVTDSKSDKKILQVLQTGYLYNEQLIRPAKVKVGKPA